MTRLRITKIESATNPAAFSDDAIGEETAGATRNTAVVSIDQRTDDRKFMRVSASAIKK